MNQVAASARVLQFPVERAVCTCCGATFCRRRGESWKNRCIDCWRWGKAAQLMEQAARLLREAR